MMKIELLGWESCGLRCPDIKIDLTNAGAPAQVGLIQMPNGTGKTTTLEVLRAALDGSANQWSEEKIRSYRRAGTDLARGEFVVRLAVDGRTLTFELALDYERGRIQYRTTRFGSGGVVPGWSPPAAVRRFLAPKFLDLFVFDGEFASRLFDSSGLEAEGAIEALCQLYLLGEISGFAESVWTRRAKQSGGGKSDTALARLEQLREELSARRAYVEQKRDEAVKSAYTLASEIEALDRKIEERLAGVEATRGAFQDAQLTLVKAKHDLDRIGGETIATLRNPLALHLRFSEMLWTLKDNLDKLRLPENTSAQFFIDLIKEDECICGREMTVGAAAEIESRSSQYLDDIASGFLNAMKQDIERVGDPAQCGPLRETFAASLADLAAARRQRREAQQTVELLQRQLIDAGDDELKNWQQQRKKASERLEGAQELLRRVNAPDSGEEEPQSWSLASLSRQLTAVGSKIATITQTLSLRSQTNVLQGILSRAQEFARAEIKADLINVCNDRLREVLVNDPLRIASCVFQTIVGTDSTGRWARFPRDGGHGFHGKVGAVFDGVKEAGPTV